MSWTVKRTEAATGDWELRRVLFGGGKLRENGVVEVLAKPSGEGEERADVGRVGKEGV